MSQNKEIERGEWRGNRRKFTFVTNHKCLGWHGWDYADDGRGVGWRSNGQVQGWRYLQCRYCDARQACWIYANRRATQPPSWEWLETGKWPPRGPARPPGPPVPAKLLIREEPDILDLLQDIHEESHEPVSPLSHLQP